VALAVIASLLIILFQASVTRLIPLYAIGVFLSFTLSQTGMARRWWKAGHLKPGEEVKEPGSVLKHDSGWKFKMIVNGFGALCTITVMFVFGITKFSEGAWIIIVLTPILVTIFFTIHHHYKGVASRLSLDIQPNTSTIRRNRVILLLGGVHQGSLAGLRYAKNLSTDITAVHTSIDPAETDKVISKWDTYGEGYRLIVLQSPYRLIIEPILEYLAYIENQRQENEMITIIVSTHGPSRKSRGLVRLG
jgi:hypothetical protein